MEIPKTKRIVNKKAIRAAMKDRCELCGSTWLLQVHHKRPKSVGGDDTPDNLICVCGNCHIMLHQNPQYARKNRPQP